MFITNLENYFPKNKYSTFIKEYFVWIEKYWIKKYIENIDVDIKFIEINNLLIPLSFWNNKKNCYTTSILWSIRYAREEVLKEKNKLKVFFYKYLLDILYFILKILKVENTVFVFNLFLSTILYPELDEKTIVKLIKILEAKYPNKAIVFRSINNDLTWNIKSKLENNSFYRLASRQIFYSSLKEKDIILKKKSFIEDWRYFRKIGYKIKNTDFNDNDIIRIKTCYDVLYLNKYSSNNPKFTLDYYKNLIKIYIFYINILWNENIEAVYWYYNIWNQITTPIFWYNLKNNKNKKLYRQISYLLTIDWFKIATYINQSSWVWEFKLNRWAKMDIEYTMFYIKHLNFFRRLPWLLLKIISKYIVEKELKSNIY